MYVIQRDDGKFVKASRFMTLRQGSSYTDNLRYAACYPNIEDARKACCPENERVASLQEFIQAENHH